MKFQRVLRDTDTVRVMVVISDEISEPNPFTTPQHAVEDRIPQVTTDFNQEPWPSLNDNSIIPSNVNKDRFTIQIAQIWTGRMGPEVDSTNAQTYTLAEVSNLVPRRIDNRMSSQIRMHGRVFTMVGKDGTTTEIYGV